MILSQQIGWSPTGDRVLMPAWPVDDVDKAVHKSVPMALSVHRRTGAIRIRWTKASDDVLQQVLKPLLDIGEAVLALENKKRPEAAPPAPGQGKTSSKDS